MERLKGKYHIDIEPGARYAIRYSVPATFTEEILRGMIRNMRTAYPRVRIWVKVGASRDALEVIRIASEEGAHAVILDGMEGGTGMAPKAALDHLGLPTLAMLAVAAEARRRGYHLVASLALGASGIYLDMPLVIVATAAGSRGVKRYIDSIRVEAQMLASALGKYRLAELSPDDVAALDPHAASALHVRYALEPWAKMGEEPNPRVNAIP